VVDQTGDLKKGTATVGVQRQYTAAGRIENAQSPPISYPEPPADALPSTAPRMCHARGPNDLDRCRSAGMPDGLAFATKPQLAARMIQRALDAGTLAH
jgi:SRSO17 transposase